MDRWSNHDHYYLCKYLWCRWFDTITITHLITFEPFTGKSYLRFRLWPELAPLAPPAAPLFISSSSRPASARIFSTSAKSGLYAAVELGQFTSSSYGTRPNIQYRSSASPKPSRRRSFPRLSLTLWAFWDQYSPQMMNMAQHVDRWTELEPPTRTSIKHRQCFTWKWGADHVFNRSSRVLCHTHECICLGS